MGRGKYIDPAPCPAILSARTVEDAFATSVEWSGVADRLGYADL
jgi:hypothetical protein